MSGKKISNENAINGADGEPSKHSQQKFENRILAYSVNSGWNERFLQLFSQFPRIHKIHLCMGFPWRGEPDERPMARDTLHELRTSNAKP